MAPNKWSASEENQLLEAWQKYDGNYDLIHQQLPHRTIAALRTRLTTITKIQYDTVKNWVNLMESQGADINGGKTNTEFSHHLMRHAAVRMKMQNIEDEPEMYSFLERFIDEAKDPISEPPCENENHTPRKTVCMLRFSTKVINEKEWTKMNESATHTNDVMLNLGEERPLPIFTPSKKNLISTADFEALHSHITSGPIKATTIVVNESLSNANCDVMADKSINTKENNIPSIPENSMQIDYDTDSSEKYLPSTSPFLTRNNRSTQKKKVHRDKGNNFMDAYRQRFPIPSLDIESVVCDVNLNHQASGSIDAVNDKKALVEADEEESVCGGSSSDSNVSNHLYTPNFENYSGKKKQRKRAGVMSTRRSGRRDIKNQRELGETPINKSANTNYAQTHNCNTANISTSVVNTPWTKKIYDINHLNVVSPSVKDVEERLMMISPGTDEKEFNRYRITGKNDILSFSSEEEDDHEKAELTNEGERDTRDEVEVEDNDERMTKTSIVTDINSVSRRSLISFAGEKSYRNNRRDYISQSQNLMQQRINEESSVHPQCVSNDLYNDNTSRLSNWIVEDSFINDESRVTIRTEPLYESRSLPHFGNNGQLENTSQGNFPHYSSDDLGNKQCIDRNIFNEEIPKLNSGLRLPQDELENCRTEVNSQYSFLSSHGKHSVQPSCAVTVNHSFSNARPSIPADTQDIELKLANLQLNTESNLNVQIESNTPIIKNIQTQCLPLEQTNNYGAALSNSVPECISLVPSSDKMLPSNANAIASEKKTAEGEIPAIYSNKEELLSATIARDPQIVNNRKEDVSMILKIDPVRIELSNGETPTKAKERLKQMNDKDYLTPGKELMGSFINTTVGKLYIGSCIGKGGYGGVYKVREETTGEQYALKIICKRSLEKEVNADDFYNEVRIHSRLNHPNIIKLYTCLEDNNYIYLVLELARCSLFKQLCKVDRFTEQQAALVIGSVIRAIDYLYSFQFIHRDIKPCNILIASDGRTLKLSDFGLTTSIKKRKKRSTYCGTLTYMAPEFFDQDHLHDEKVDVWSIGVMALELLSLNHPFEDDDDHVVERNIINLHYEMPDDISMECRDFLRQVLKKRPQDRMSTQQMIQHPWIIMHEQPYKYVRPPWIANRVTLRH